MHAYKKASHKRTYIVKSPKQANPQRKKAEWCLLRAVGCGAGGDLEREGCGVIANVNGFFLREIKMF